MKKRIFLLLVFLLAFAAVSAPAEEGDEYDYLDENPDAKPETLLRTVRKHIDDFVGDAPQFDDITMLGLAYHGMEGRDDE